MKEKVFERREELLDAALVEFSQKSYDDASLNNIIKAAGISKGTFYYHFENKEQLYLHMLDRTAKAKWAFISAHFPAVIPESNDIFDLFAVQAELGIQFAQSEPRYSLLYSMFLRERDNPIYKKARFMLEGKHEHMVEDMVSKAYDAGAFKRVYSPEFVCRMMAYMFSCFNDIFPEAVDLATARKNLQDFILFMKIGLAK